MDLKQRIQAAFTDSPLRKVRVEVKRVAGRLLVYVVSPTFAHKTPLQKQRLALKTLRGAGTLSAEDLRRVGLVRPLTPGAYRTMKAFKAKPKNAGGKPKKKAIANPEEGKGIQEP